MTLFCGDIARWGLTLLLALLAVATSVSWASPAHPDPQLDREQALARQLRCPVCQNQTLADSNADLARDLRKEITQQIVQGRTDDEIRAFMVQRYGEFVLYEPPLQAQTLMLWGAPFVMLAVVVGVLAWQWRRQQGRGAARPEPLRHGDRPAETSLTALKDGL